MRFRQSHHSLETLGIEPIVGKDHLAIFTGWGHLAESVVVIRYDAQECGVVVDADTRISRGVTMRDGQGFIGAAVVGNDVFPIAIVLRQDAFDALRKMLFAVVDGSNHTNQGTIGHFSTSLLPTLATIVSC